MYAGLSQSDTVQTYGRSKVGTRSGGVGLCKKPKDLSAREREDRGHGEGVITEDVVKVNFVRMMWYIHER